MHKVHQLRPSSPDGRATVDLDGDSDGAPTVEFISVPEWCRRVGCSLDAGYRAARRDEIVGLFRIGKLMRINWQAFVAATFSGTDGRRASGG
jgi:hypothetical protein